MTFDADEWDQRCPYCQSLELIRLDTGSTLGIDAVRCPGCGSQFNIDRRVDRDEFLDQAMLAVSG